MINKKLLALAALIVLGTAFSAKADTLTFANSQVYYVGDASDGMDNPFGLTNPGGNPISVLGMTSAGAQGTLVFDTGGTPGVSLISNKPGLFDVQLYGNTSNIINGGKLVTGSYTFSSASDSFEVNGYTNSGTNPIDYVTINVAANGIVTLQSDSLELATDPTPPSNPPTTGVPEIDPAAGGSALTLIAGAVLIIRGRRKNLTHC